MSTTFGIPIHSDKTESEEKFVNIAFRSGIMMNL